MDFGWASCFNGFWVLPLLCLLFMAVMMIGCRSMPSRCGGDGSHRQSPRVGADSGEKKS